MYKVYIVDDELVVRQGLKIILDWNALGFEICGEASDGITAYHEILKLRPDLILVDIHMPKMRGLDMANQLRASGYVGRIIVLSGYSEFKYAQEAIMYGVDFYLTKPIEEEELREAVQSVYNSLNKNQIKTESFSYYQEKARDKILEEIIKKGHKDPKKLESSLEELNLEANSYQVLILSKYDTDYDAFTVFCDEMKISVTNKDIEHLHEQEHEIILLKGDYMIKRFNDYQEKQFDHKDKQFFIALGNVVEDVNNIHLSYCNGLAAKDRSFFSKEKQFIEVDVNHEINSVTNEHITAGNSRIMGKELYQLIISHDINECRKFLDGAFERLSYSNNNAKTIKNFLAGMFIFIVNAFKTDYAHYNVEFNSNAEIINLIQNKAYLYEIIEYILSEIENMILKTRDFSSDEILGEIKKYIDYHYAEDVKLKTIAPRFGYNSCYLGKIFNQKVGVSFNDYVHQVRIEKSKRLLLNSNQKVYEVSNLVGYSKVDYFHMKFKEQVGCTPVEYRMKHETGK